MPGDDADSGVGRLLFDRLTTNEIAVLSTALQRVLDGLEPSRERRDA